MVAYGLIVGIFLWAGLKCAWLCLSCCLACCPRSGDSPDDPEHDGLIDPMGHFAYELHMDPEHQTTQPPTWTEAGTITDTASPTTTMLRDFLVEHYHPDSPEERERAIAAYAPHMPVRRRLPCDETL